MRAALVLLLLSPSLYAHRSLNFDFDDNIFVTDAKVYLWDSAAKKELGFSTAEWSHVRDTVGKAGKLKNAVQREDFLRDFEDGKNGSKVFTGQIERALTAQKWKGPVWDAFVYAMSDAALRDRTHIITARGHASKTLVEGFEVLQKAKLIEAVPAKENAFAVLGPDLPAEFKDISSSESKAKVMISLLDGLNKEPLAPGEKRHLWAFSDDDFGNISKAWKALAAEVARDRWKKTTVLLAFTGTNNPKEKPRCFVIDKKGERACTKTEKARSFYPPFAKK